MKVLITGGTGTLGQALVKRLTKNPHVTEIRVYSRDEYKQSEMARKESHKRVKFWLGDVRDLERLKEACEGIDLIIHAAALKRMDTTSHNTFTVADVNIVGTNNVAIAGRNAKDIILVSTDKAFEPSCVYGASKMIAESIILARPNGTVWRFGNFIGSRGSVWEIFKEQAKKGKLTVTDPFATRFVIDVEEVVNCILSGIRGGLHFPGNLRTMTVAEIAEEVAPGVDWELVGLREGEKMHESFTKTYTSKKYDEDTIL